VVLGGGLGVPPGHLGGKEVSNRAGYPQNKLDMHNSRSVIVHVLYQPFAMGGMVLDAMVRKLYKATARPPSTSPTAGDGAVMEILTTSVDKNFLLEGDKSILSDIWGGQRNSGGNFLNFADARVFWPPPLASPFMSGSASAAWSTSLKDGETVQGHLQVAGQALGVEVRAFRSEYTTLPHYHKLTLS
jgi:hypothetical protein